MSRQAPMVLPTNVRLGLAALAGVVVSYLAWQMLGGPEGAYNWVRAAVAWPGIIEFLLALVAWAVWIGLLLAAGVATALGLYAVLGQHVRNLVGMFGALIIFAMMAGAVMDTQPWEAEQAAGANTTATNDAEGGMDALVESLFDTHVIALEVLGILLTAAMIGALVIARPLGQSHADPAMAAAAAVSSEEEE